MIYIAVTVDDDYPIDAPDNISVEMAWRLGNRLTWKHWVGDEQGWHPCVDDCLSAELLAMLITRHPFYTQVPGFDARRRAVTQQPSDALRGLSAPVGALTAGSGGAQHQIRKWSRWGRAPNRP